MALVRGRQVSIAEIPLSDLRKELQNGEPYSYWGHMNTRLIAETLLGVSLEPRSERPAVKLDGDGFPSLYGRRFDRCYVLSPDYADSIRPRIGSEITVDAIVAWHALRIDWVA